MGQALGLTGAGADELKARLDRAGEHLRQGEAPVLRIIQDLEDEGDRTVITLVDVEVVAVHQRHGAEVARTREVGRDVIHQARDALLGSAGAGKDGYKDALRNGLGEQALELLLGELAIALEVFEHELVIRLDDKLAQVGASLLGGVRVLRGDVALDGLARIVKVTGLHADDVDDALEVPADAPRQRDGAKALAKALLQRGERGVILGLGSINAVHEDGTREGEVLGGIPQASGDGTRVSRGVDDEDGRLDGGHSSIGIADEVRIAGGVNDVQARAAPGDGRHGKLDRERALLFLRVVVERGLGALVATQATGDA